MADPERFDLNITSEILSVPLNETKPETSEEKINSQDKVLNDFLKELSKVKE